MPKSQHIRVLALRLHLKSGRHGRESNLRPWVKQHNALATDPPRWGASQSHWHPLMPACAVAVR